MANNLLDKSSIILTPTAYNNGEALCVKPSDGSGDFTFSRNSAATRVNAQGLVENVQILSSNLVQNGDFSEEGVQEVSNGSFSQEGVQLVTNGSFDTDSDWTKGTGWSISGGTANALSVGSGQSLSQGTSIVSSKIYRVDYTVSNFVEGGVYVRVGNSGTGTIRQENGTYTEYITQSGNTTIYFTAYSGSTTLSIDNCSVREVGQDWTLGGEVTIGDNLAHFESNTNTYSYIRQDISSLTSKTYKIQLEVKNYVSGAVQVAFSGASPIAQNLNVSTDGVYTAYLTPNANGDDFEVSREFNGGNFNFDITNISVKEVGQNWVLDSANIEVGKLTLNSVGGAMTYAYQGGLTLVANTSYLISLNAARISGNTNLAFGSDGVNNVSGSPIISTSGFQSYNFTPTTNVTNFGLKRNAGGSGAVWDITNISIIEITSDTNLPRINYEGFSYQDALGSELVLNGGFDTDLSSWNNGNSYWQWSSKGAYHPLGSVNNGFNQSFTTQPNKLTFSVEIISGVLAVEFDGVYTFNQSGVYTIYGTTGVVNFKRSGSLECYIDNVSVKEYLGQDVVPDSGCGSWLFEPQSTNLITYSEDFSQWSQTFTNVGTNELVSPDGTLNASKITATSTSQPRVEQSFSVPSVDTKNTFSVFVKKGNTSYIALSRFSGSQSAIFDLDTISIVSQSSENATIKEMGNGWFKISITQTVLSTDTYNVWKINLTNGISTNVGVVGEYVYIWGAQLEQQTYATSYIPTENNPNGVTRNQDVCTNGGSLASINSTEGVLYAEIAALAKINPSGNITLTDGTGNNRIYIYYLIDNSISVIYNVNSTGASINNFSLANITDQTKIAVRWGNSNVSVWINGASVLSNTTSNFLPNTLNVLSFAKPSGGVPFEGKTKALAVFPILSDSELQSLTTI